MKPTIIQIGPGQVWKLVYEWQIDTRYGNLTVPGGITFDAASVPRLVWTVIDPMDLTLEAALVHDWLYRVQGVGIFDGRYKPISRRQVDELFGDVMRRRGVNLWRRKAAWLAVRLFGGQAWRSGE